MPSTGACRTHHHRVVVLTAASLRYSGSPRRLPVTFERPGIEHRAANGIDKRLKPIDRPGLGFEGRIRENWERHERFHSRTSTPGGESILLVSK